MAPRLPLLGLALFAGLSTLGCDLEDDELRALDLEVLDERFACGDVTVVAASPDGSEALFLGIEDGLAAELAAHGGVVEAHYTLPDDRLTLRWVTGSNVYQGQCGRSSDRPWHIDDRHEGAEGELTIRLEPGVQGEAAITAQFDYVLFVDTEEDEPSYELMPTRLEAVMGS
ncbi:hypothetical protein G6O69_28930 [Pseudenhygromyxa sp. WMMC2535]|uniref:hypothetical protein n=1 Tax=Pseudenhygromyxa sp. WMMC2535 TaxID=2712867 RepID=UPI0015573CBC|nr:hypothetical protein [Pseudenhygromyxa sp. WMMC2535]NVB41890.1 hypothetical protein [Pseudenhygromyxa sp. WMMC2535]